MGDPRYLGLPGTTGGVNSSPYVALLALKSLVSENPTNVLQLTLQVIESCRYMDNILLASDSLSDLEMIAKESVDLFVVLNYENEFRIVTLKVYCCKFLAVILHRQSGNLIWVRNLFLTRRH